MRTDPELDAMLEAIQAHMEAQAVQLLGGSAVITRSDCLRGIIRKVYSELPATGTPDTPDTPDTPAAYPASWTVPTGPRGRQ